MSQISKAHEQIKYTSDNQNHIINIDDIQKEREENSK